MGVNWGEKAFFSYELDNRRFSSYAAEIEVSVWRMQEKVAEVLSQPFLVAPWGKGQLEWVIDTTELLPANSPPEQSFEYTVLIKRGEIERKIILYISVSAYPPKPLPIPRR
jgi:hypothetical protein